MIADISVPMLTYPDATSAGAFGQLASHSATPRTLPVSLTDLGAAARAARHHDLAMIAVQAAVGPRLPDMSFIVADIARPDLSSFRPCHRRSGGGSRGTNVPQEP